MLYEEQVLEPSTRGLLIRLASVLGEDFYLVGGTALAIHLGHRLSIHLDFFTGESFSEDAVLQRIESELAPAVVTTFGRAENTLNLSVEGVKVDILRYAYPLIEQPRQVDGYQLLEISDIAAMKLAAITKRGSKKDFFDIAVLLRDRPLDKLLDYYSQKFPTHKPFMVIRSLGYFDDAEQARSCHDSCNGLGKGKTDSD